MPSSSELPGRVEVLIEVPRGSFIKRELHGEGRIDYVSPVPSPFNYGCVPSIPGQDGDPLDAVVLGPRRALGEQVEGAVVGVVRFWDAGAIDDKLVVSEGELSEHDERALRRFFRVYAVARRLLNLRRGRTGHTGFHGVVRREALLAGWRNGR